MLGMYLGLLVGRIWGLFCCVGTVGCVCCVDCCVGTVGCVCCVD